MENTPQALFDFEDEEENEVKPNLGEYWKIKNGNNFLFAQITSENPIVVKYFTPTVKGTYYYLDEKPFDVCSDDLYEKIEPPKIIPKGKHRKFYQFNHA